MENMEEQIGAVLNNPQLMQQIMSMAQALGQYQDTSAQRNKNSSSANAPDIDLSIIQKISGLAQQSGIDTNQQTLLQALSPYLSQDRVTRLERAMRAAKMARYASTLLGSVNLQTPSGR